MRSIKSALLLALLPMPATAAERLVRNSSEFAVAMKQATPGDTIRLADGVWRDFQMVVEGRGTAARPITLTAQTKGKVVLSGASNLRIGGEHLVISGLIFRDGASPTKEVIAFRRDTKTFASNVRLTEIVIDRFNQRDRRTEDIWVAIYGADNRVDHSWFAGKGNAGVTLGVIRPEGDRRQNRHRIDHNYFGPRPPLGSNGGETIRIGTSEESLSDSTTVIERNYFDRCDGEVEIVSIKSGGNLIRENTIFQSQGSIVLRHGNGNIVERNVILGGGKASTGGIRIINRDQIVRGNYIEGTRGTDFTSAIAVMNGVPNSPINRYHQVANAVIENNSIIDPARIIFGAGNDAERSAPPVASRFSGNLIHAAKDPFRAEGDVSGISLSGNVVSFTPAMAGMTRQPLTLARAHNGLLYSDSNVGAPRDLKPVTKAEVGPNWYSKADATFSFGAGRSIAVAPGRLAESAAAAGPGDTLRLAAGVYAVSAPIAVDRPLTIAGPTTARLTFSTPTLFQLNEGGAIRLEGLTISGSAAPRTAGNAVIRSAPHSTIASYAVEIDRVSFRDMAASPRFDVIATTKSTLASHIVIRKTNFAAVSGRVVAAAAETTTAGHYGAERIVIADSTFADVDRIADVARLGTDESTFGPQFTMVGSRVSRGGTPSLKLSGVQHAEISGNSFAQAGRIEIAHSVGSPDTRITGNRFVATPPPAIANLYSQSSSRVVVADNIGLQ